MRAFLRRVSTTSVLLAVFAVLLVARYAGHVSWAARAAVGLVLAFVVLRWGAASLRPLRVGEKTYDPVDVVEPAGVPIYACAACGTQVLLLRKGSDKPPRHCGEAMAYSVVPEVPDHMPDDFA